RDAQTLIVTLESPAPYFPWLVATWTYYPLRRDQIQQLGPAWSEPDNLVGNGPYVVQGIRGPDVVLARNEQYGGPRPAVERIVFRAYPTIGEALEAFRQREL